MTGNTVTNVCNPTVDHDVANKMYVDQITGDAVSKNGGTMMGNHRLRSSASPVLTVTHHFYRSPRLSDFFFDLGSGGQTPQRTFTQNG